MSESAEFILKLNDQVSGPAKRAADALRSVDDRAQAAANRGIAKFEAATRRMGLAQVSAAKLNAQFDKRQAELAKKNTFFGGFGQKLGFRSVADYAKGAFIGELAAKGVETIVGGFVTGAQAAIGLLTSGVKMAFVEGGKAENLRLSYKHLLGAAGGKAALDSISGFAGKTKFDDDKIAELMRPLYRSGMSGVGARTAFALAGDANVRTGEDPSETIAGLAKIQLKGGVTEKLIVGLGVSVREFKDALSTETGIRDKEAAFVKASSGKLDPTQIQNAIVRATEKHFGTKTGTATNEGAQTMSARLEKIGDLPSQYLKKMSESPAWAVLSRRLGDTLKALDPDGPRGQKIIASLFRVFGQLSDWMQRTLTANNFDRFAAGASAVVDSLTKLPAILNTVLSVSEALAAVWLGSKVVDGIVAAAGAATLVSAPLIAAGAAMASVAFAMERIAAAVKELGGAGAVGRDVWDFVKSGGMQVPAGTPGISQDDFDTKYGGDGHRVRPAPSIDSRRAITLSVGDINVTAPEGASAKEHATLLVKSFQEQFQKAMELAAQHGGG